MQISPPLDHEKVKGTRWPPKMQLLIVIYLIWVCLLSAIDVDSNHHCIIIHSRPGACYYFVHNSVLDHDASFDHCALQYNARLATIENQSMIRDLARAYHWWPGYRAGQTFRLGQYLRKNGEPSATRNEISDLFTCNVINTKCNFAHRGFDIDDSTWERVFCTADGEKEEMAERAWPCTDIIDKRNCTALGLEIAPDWNRVRTHDPEAARDFKYLAIDMDSAQVAMVGKLDPTPFVCESPRYPKSFCAEGWTLHTRSCFKVMGERATHAQAMAGCRRAHACLASINDLSEWELVKNLGYGDLDGIYFGLRYSAANLRGKSLFERRRLFWHHAFNVDGSKIHHLESVNGDYHEKMMNNSRYPPWDDDQPQARDERCLASEYDQWHAHAADSDAKFTYVCRKMAEQVPFSKNG